MQRSLGNFGDKGSIQEEGSAEKANRSPLRVNNCLSQPFKSAMYSHSRLSCFENCRLQFKLNYIDKLETEIEESVEAFMGKRVHEALEKLYRDVKFQKVPSLKELLDFYKSEWKKNWNEKILIVRKEYSQENFRKMGEKYIRDYYERFHPFDQDTTISMEKRITIGLQGKEGERYAVQGYIDRLSSDNEGTYTIHDYKTSGTLMTKEDADNDRQLALYAIAVKELYPDCKRVLLMWHYLAFNKDVVSERTDEQLQRLKSDVIGLIKEIESTTEFPPRVSALCEWCQFRPYCPNFRHEYSLDSKEPESYLEDDGVKLVNRYAELTEEKCRAEEELAKVKEALVDFARREGLNVVQGSNVSALVKTYPRLSFPKKNDHLQKEFFDAVRKIGLWESLCTVDVYELAKMINSKEMHPELVKVLDKYIEKKSVDIVYLRKK